MAFHPDQFRPGQVLSARALNEFFAELERLGKIAIAAPLTFADDPAGLQFGIGIGEAWWVKLTTAGSGGTAGRYSWTRQQGVVGGGWIDHPGGQTGTTTNDPAVESTGKADVTTGTSAVYEARRDPTSGALVFTAGSCS